MNPDEEESEDEDDDGFSGQKKKEEVEEDPVERKSIKIMPQLNLTGKCLIIFGVNKSSF